MSSCYDVILWRHLQNFDFLAFLLTLARHCDLFLAFHEKTVTYVKQLCFGFQKMQTELKNDFSLDFYCKLNICIIFRKYDIFKKYLMTSSKNGSHFGKIFSAILFVLSQAITVPSFMFIALSILEILRGGRGVESTPPPSSLRSN